jgi:hypothetical protein
MSIPLVCSVLWMTMATNWPAIHSEWYRKGLYTEARCVEFNQKLEKKNG